MQQGSRFGLPGHRHHLRQPRLPYIVAAGRPSAGIDAYARTAFRITISALATHTLGAGDQQPVRRDVPGRSQAARHDGRYMRPQKAAPRMSSRRRLLASRNSGYILAVETKLRRDIPLRWPESKTRLSKRFRVSLCARRGLEPHGC